MGMTINPDPRTTEGLSMSTPARRNTLLTSVVPAPPGPGTADEPAPKTGRSPISRALRFQVLRRDGHACRYCGDGAQRVKLTVDHVVPVALGGTNEPSNLVTACWPCNSGKAATPPDAPIVDNVAADALRWARARTQAAAMFRLADEERDTRAELVIEHWNAMLADHRKTPTAGFSAGDDPYGSVFVWLDRGLDIEDIVRLIDQAVKWKVGKIPTQRLWAYLAGCCWNRIRAIDEEAQAILDAEAEGSDDERGKVAELHANDDRRYQGAIPGRIPDPQPIDA